MILRRDHPDRGRRGVPAQPGAPDPRARRGGRGVRQGPLAARSAPPAPRRSAAPARAFLSMRSRLERQIEQRTQMLSGVSHDLRTPLTRMKLTLALMDETEETRDLRARTPTRWSGCSASSSPSPAATASRRRCRPTRSRSPPASSRTPAAPAPRSACARVGETRRGATVPLRPGAVAPRGAEPRRQRRAATAAACALTVRLAARSGSPSSSRTTAPASPRPTAPARCSPSPGSTPRAPQTDGGSVGLGLSIALDVARSHGGSLELGAEPRPRRPARDPPPAALTRRALAPRLRRYVN